MESWITRTELIMLGRLVLAVVLAGLVGYEREQADKPAGFRTHILVGMGAALFTVVSIYGFGGASDPARVAAQIVTGIGFLGAGTIFRSEGLVLGLTTAASIWAVAAIGMAVAVGMYAMSAVATAIMLLVLRLPLKRSSRNAGRPASPQ
jgi:putative Mg2+ transporter-C (MgtC) family protein